MKITKTSSLVCSPPWRAFFRLSSKSHRRFAFFSGDFTDEFWHEIAGELGANLRNKFLGAFIADFKMCNAFRMVQLVQVVGEDSLLKKLAT